MGESVRSIEETAIRSKLQPLGYEIHEVKADGHCLYRSLEDQLALRARPPRRRAAHRPRLSATHFALSTAPPGRCRCRCPSWLGLLRIPGSASLDAAPSAAAIGDVCPRRERGDAPWKRLPRPSADGGALCRPSFDLPSHRAAAPRHAPSRHRSLCTLLTPPLCRVSPLERVRPRARNGVPSVPRRVCRRNR